MLIEIADFNGADEYYANGGTVEWADLQAAFTALPLFLQGSLQRGRIGSPIFDPKATNLYLSTHVAGNGWVPVPVPTRLRMFGVDWDAGKGGTLAEWQFSNYPFLWNNIIRSEAVFRSGTSLPNVPRTQAMVQVTKAGAIPSSNSSLYFEQARAQLQAVTSFKAFTLPIRLVGLMLPPGATVLPVGWTVYGGRTSRTVATPTVNRSVNVRWPRGGRAGARTTMTLI